MRTRLIRAGVPAGLVLLLVAAFPQWCTRFETPERHYATYAEAARAGALGEAAPLGGLLPRSATDVRVALSIDTNELWVRFRIARADSAALVRAWRPSSWAEAGRPRVFSWQGWWAPPPSAAVYAPLRRKPYPSCLAVDWPRELVYAFTCTIVAANATLRPRRE